MLPLRPFVRRRQHGQTLVISLIVLSVLLVLGLVFLSLVNRNIRNVATGQRRSEAADLAEAGVRYAHGQLVSSPQGADWRGTPATLTQISADVTVDPDAYYLRPGYHQNNPAYSSGVPGDLGGPDGMGPFVRVPFQNGRSLVRVRYGATDATPTPALPGGPLRNPGKARATIIIESVGRPGALNLNDPTTVNAAGGLQFQNFGNAGNLQAGIAAMAQADGQIPTSRRLVAFAPIGIIDAARFETNVFNSASPIPIGIPDGLNTVAYHEPGFTAKNDLSTNLRQQLGAPPSATNPALASVLPGGFGRIIVNGDLQIYGTNDVYLNRALGDSIQVSGAISAANSVSKVNITPYDYVSGVYTAGAVVPLSGASLDSTNAAFDTVGGLVVDGVAKQDASGNARGVGKLEPPSILTVDPQTKANRYVEMTRESGAGGAGRFGHGQGVYVDNASDRQEATDALGRQIAGSQQSLFDDWLRPNSGQANSGWQGPFYTPPAAIVQLLPDGWTVQRFGGATWKDATGADTTLSTMRYRVGAVNVNGVAQLRVLDTVTAQNTTPPQDINANNLNYTQAPPFNGVLYFEGNVRVRGTIPTDVQMTLVSNATIYIDGSILKGTSNNDVTGGQRDQQINKFPTATLMLMAKDNVALNTSMFFGPSANQTLEPKNDTSGTTNVNSVLLPAAGGRLNLLTELPLDSSANPSNASGWKPLALNYVDWEKPSNAIPTQMLLGITMDDGTASASFFSLDVNYGAANSDYKFSGTDPLITNTAYTYLGTATTPVYGMGAEPWQRFSRFEMRTFPLIPDPANKTYTNDGRITEAGTFTLYAGGNDVLMQPGSLAGVSANDTLVGRAAVVPGDVRIEASIFAEQGSFFVIPGPWFNPNPNDTHSAYALAVTDYVNKGLTQAQAELRASRDRLEAYGTAPGAPFYAEPLDVRINIVGSVAENLPPPVSVQAEWIKKWGWIPRRIGATGVGIPLQHVPGGDANNVKNEDFVPNLIIQYDPVLATGRQTSPTANLPIRTDDYGRPLPPMPRLPVSPKLAYFGEL